MPTMLTLLTASQPELVEVKVPAYLFWYMGIAVGLCVVVFFVLPVVLSSRRKSRARRAQQETAPDADNA